MRIPLGPMAACAAVLMCQAPGVAQTVDYSKGLVNHSAFQLNGTAIWSGNSVQLTESTAKPQAGSMFTVKPLQIAGGFETEYDFFMTDLIGVNGGGDGITFTIQGNSPSALGETGSGLGYVGIPKSVTVKYDIYEPSSSSTSSVGTLVGGVDYSGISTLPDVDLHSGHPFRAHLTYAPPNGSTTDWFLSTDLHDLQTNKHWGMSWYVPHGGDWISRTIGSDQGYVGFTGATYSAAARQGVSSFYFRSYDPLPEPAFYQMAALLGLAGLGALRMRRRRA